MKNTLFYFTFLIMLFSAGLQAQTQFWVDDFEGVNSSSGTRTPENNGGVGGPPFTSYFCRTPANGTVSQAVPFTGFQGSNYWAGEDHDASGTGFPSAGTSAGIVRQQDITWTGINIAGKTNLSFTGSFAANSTNQPFDNRNACSGGATTNTDYVILQHSIDGGAWTDDLRWFTNGALTGKYLFLETTGDSCGDGAQLTNIFQDFSANITGTGSTMSLRLLAYSEGGNEEWGVDNFRLFEVSSCTAPTLVSNPPNRTICDGTNTTFVLSVTGATTYQWQVDQTGSGSYTDLPNTAPYSGITTSTLTLTGVTAAMNGYRYRAVAINGVATCTTNSNYGTLTVSSPTTTGSQNTVSCFGGNNGSASITPGGGIPTYTYSWSPGGSTGPSVSGLTAGIYTCTVTDAIGCTNTRSYIITQPSALVTTTAVTNVACNGGSNGVASITPSGGTGSYTYLWSNGASTSAITGRMAGIYTATVTDANNCTSIKSAQITQPTVLVTSTAVTNVACNGGSNGVAAITTSGGAGGYSYLWSNGGSTSAITGMLAGVYTATVTDANSCTSIKSAQVTQPTALVTTTAVTNVACNGGSNGVASITPSGGAGSYTYLWSNGGSTSAITGLLSGVYTATVTDANSCTSIKSAQVTQPTALVTTTAVTNVACNGGSNGVASITATGGTAAYTYLWSNGASTSAITGLLAGVYTATVTDANSCTSIKSAQVTQPTALVTTTAITNVACNGGSNGVASITPSGGAGSYTYLWSNGGSTSAITGLLSGVYTATVTDANSCTSIKSAQVTQPTALVTTTAVTNVACNGGSNGVASITPSGGAGSYTYLWSNGGSTSAITGLLSGVYTATVTDANSCTSIKSAQVTQPTALVTTTAVTNVACNGGSNGVASITATGGMAAYTYLWNTGASTSAITGLLAGVYTATVTDANGCTSSKSSTVTQPTALVTTTAVTNVACNGGSNGVASITATGGTAAYTYLWNTGASTSAITGLLAGVYTATVTDANGCTSTKNLTITEPTALIATISSTNTGCGANTGIVAVSASGGTGTLTYSWSPTGSTTVTVSALGIGTYSCDITDANTCMITKIVNVSSSGAPIATATQTNVSCNSLCDGKASVLASGGSIPYSYLWSNNATTATITGLCAGVQSCTVTGDNGCSTTVTVTITEPALLTTTITSSPILCHGGLSTVTVSATGGTIPYAGVGSFTAAAGANTYTVTDANACSNTTSITITEPAAIVASQTLSLCAGQTVTVGTNTYTATGIYTATLTALNGCDSTITTNLTVNPVPVISVNSGAICAGKSFTMTPSGAATYTYSSGNAVVSPTTTTSYTVTGTSAGGCGTSNMAIATITVNALPSVSLTVATGTTCINSGSIALTGSPVGGAYSGTNVSGTAFTPATSGTFTPAYSFTNSITGCSSTATTAIVVGLCTGIETLDGKEAVIRVYPNPATGVFTLELANRAQISISNAIGSLVLMPETLEAGKHGLDLSNEANGIYFIRVTENGKSSVVKLVKQ